MFFFLFLLLRYQFYSFWWRVGCCRKVTFFFLLFSKVLVVHALQILHHKLEVILRRNDHLPIAQINPQPERRVELNSLFNVTINDISVIYVTAYAVQAD